MKEYIYIFELRIDQSADEALKQIVEKGLCLTFCRWPAQTAQDWLEFLNWETVYWRLEGCVNEFW